MVSKKKSLVEPLDDVIDERDDKHGIQVVSRALAVLKVLGANPGGLSLAEIAGETELPRSTVQRLVGALEVEGFVEPVGRNGGSRLGPAVLQLVHTAHGDIISVARPLLQKLSEAVNESVTLASATGRQTVMIDRIVVEREVCIMIPIGVVQSPWTTSNGKALLATLPDEVVLKLLSQDNSAPRTLASEAGRTRFIKQLRDIRESGLSYDREETYQGVCSVGLAMQTNLGTYAIAIVTPSMRFESHLAKLGQELVKCKQEIEKLIGEKKSKGRQA